MASCCCKTTNRHPHSFPVYENDTAFTGPTGLLPPKHSSDIPIEKSQRQQPWHRLSESTTLASIRHNALYFDPKAPRDDLDFLLNSVYNNREALLATKPEVCMQPSTVGIDTGRVMNKHSVPVQKKEMHLNHPLRIVTQEKRETLDSIKKAIGKFTTTFHLNFINNRFHNCKIVHFTFFLNSSGSSQ